MIDSFDWPGGREAMLCLGPAAGPVVLLASPLFEEANRTRALIVTMGRVLDSLGIGFALPDLPGQGESLVATETATLEHWRQAFSHAARALAPRPLHVASLRGGALIDDAADALGYWRFAPITGAAATRDLLRASRIGSNRNVDMPDFAAEGVVDLSGNRLSQSLLRDLTHAQPRPLDRLRTVRLANDPAPADRKIEASPLWRRAEPDNDRELAALLANDIAAWMSACAA